MQRCNYCVMEDSSDETIIFDEKGVCNYCTQAKSLLRREYFPNGLGEEKLQKMLLQIKKEGKGKKYDCLMGISGGLDSSYLAYLGNIWGLRILGVHIDDGFDTDISKRNIKKLCQKANIDLIIIKPDEEQYYSLIKAYMKASVPDLAVPQDNILFANLYQFAYKENIKYFLSGSNLALESILQRGNSHNAEDLVNIKDISRKFNQKPINKLNFMSRYKKEYYSHICKIVTVKPLNLLEYNRKRAFKELGDFCGFEYYGRKHLENIFTSFLQLYWLPQKFNVDKRTSHLSSLIVSEQMTRIEAMKELEEPLYKEDLMDYYIKIIKTSLSISDEEFDMIMAAPVKQHTDYKTDRFLEKMVKIKKKIRY